jgi:hypothetical protein
MNYYSVSQHLSRLLNSESGVLTFRSVLSPVHVDDFATSQMVLDIEE